MWHGYLATSMAKLSSCCFGFVLSHWAPLWMYYVEVQRAKGYFKDDEVGANSIVLLIVLCLWKGECRLEKKCSILW